MFLLVYNKFFNKQISALISLDTFISDMHSLHDLFVRASFQVVVGSLFTLDFLLNFL